MTKVVWMFGKRNGNERRSARVRNTVEVSGQAAKGIFPQGSETPEDGGCADGKARALARMVLDHREALGLSQREFAEASGVSRSILSKLEQGKLYPGGKVRRKLAGAMGRSPMELWRIGPDAGDDRTGFTGSPRTERIEEAS